MKTVSQNSTCIKPKSVDEEIIDFYASLTYNLQEHEQARLEAIRLSYAAYCECLAQEPVRYFALPMGGAR